MLDLQVVVVDAVGREASWLGGLGSLSCTYQITFAGTSRPPRLLAAHQFLDAFGRRLDRALLMSHPIQRRPDWLTETGARTAEAIETTSPGSPDSVDSFNQSQRLLRRVAASFVRLQSGERIDPPAPCK